MVVGPSTITCDSKRQPLLIRTRSPMRQYGPMNTFESISASGLTMAVGWIMTRDFGMRNAECGLRKLHRCRGGRAPQIRIPHSAFRIPKSLSWPLPYRRKQDRFGRELGTDIDMALHFPDDRLAANDFHGNAHLIAG